MVPRGIQRFAIAVFLAVVVSLFSEPLAAAELPSERSGELVLLGHEMLRSGQAAEALILLDEAVVLLSKGPDQQLLLAARVNRAHALAQLDRLLESMAEFAESIALADVLAPRPELSAADLGIGIRLQLAEVLADKGLAVDAQAAAWDGLQAAVRLGVLASVGPALRMVLLLGSEDDDSDSSLVELIDALNQELMALDEYRLAKTPPPEPIVAVLEASARALAVRQDLSEARELFELILLLDLARGAHWRLVSDLSDLSWVSLQQGDLNVAHWALQWTEALFQGKRPAQVWANWASLQAGSGDFVAAERSCRAAIKAAAKEKSPDRVRALGSRLARIVERLYGREEQALSLARSAAQAYRKAGDETSALAEELRIADQMLHLDRLDDAATLLAGVIGALESGTPFAADEQVLMHLVSAHLSEKRGEVAIARSALRAAGAILFDLGRVDELAALASMFGDLELLLGSHEAAAEAFENAQRFEAQLGLGSESWHSLLGQARLAVRRSDPEGAQVFLDRARERVEWQAVLSVGFDWDGELGVQDAFHLDVDGEEVYRELAMMQLSSGEESVLLETIAAAREFRRVAALSASSHFLSSKKRQGDHDEVTEQLKSRRAQIEELRARLRDEAIQPSTVEPQHVLASLAEKLDSARHSETELLDALSQSDPVAHANLSVSGPRTEQLQAALRPGELLLVSYDLKEQVVVIGLSAKEQVTFTLDDPEALIAELNALWRDFGGRKLGHAARRALSPLLMDLSQRLLLPLDDMLKSASTILWSPDPSLRAVPLAALPLGETVLSERVEVIGLHSLRSVLMPRDLGNTGTPRGLVLLPDPSRPSAESFPELRELGVQLRGLRHGNLAQMMGGASQTGALRLLVLPPHLSAGHRSAQLEGTDGPSITSLRPVEPDDRYIRVLAAELEKGGALIESTNTARRAARRKRRDPLGWASLLLWLD
jgi:tetratricopeptide (TPR) repeat protein